MIRVSMDLLSAISVGRNRHLGSITISNDGSPSTERLHNYNVVALGKNGQEIRRARVERWDREGKSPLQLLGAAVEALGYGGVR